MEGSQGEGSNKGQGGKKRKRKRVGILVFKLLFFCKYFI